MWFVLIAILVNSGVTHAWETDNVTCRTRPLQDATAALNAETNLRLQQTLTLVNARPGSRDLERFRRADELRRVMHKFDNQVQTALDDSFEPDQAHVMDLRSQFSNDVLSEQTNEAGVCNRARLIRILRHKIAAPWMGNLETWATSAPIPKCDIPVSQSIYSVFTMTESPVAKSAGINPVISVGGVRLGVDKLSHFMTEGYNYWSATHPGYDLQKALDIGIRQEEGGYGLRTTGVKSYADMAANYKGFEFWKALFDGDKPYFKCENNRWKQVRTFDWREYVDSSLDESINCNAYSTLEMERKVDAETARLWKGHLPDATRCPASISECQNLQKSLIPRLVAQTVLHPRCLEAGQNSQTPTSVDSGAVSGSPSGGIK